VHTCNTGEPLTEEVTSIRSFKHDLYLYSQEKVALTTYNDKMKMLDNINCVPFGYMD
jgi:hypothetical protein